MVTPTALSAILFFFVVEELRSVVVAAVGGVGIRAFLDVDVGAVDCLRSHAHHIVNAARPRPNKYAARPRVGALSGRVGARSAARMDAPRTHRFATADECADSGDMGNQRSADAFLITDAEDSFEAQHRARVRKYLTLMAFRAPALILAAIAYSATGSGLLALGIVVLSIPCRGWRC